MSYSNSTSTEQKSDNHTENHNTESLDESGFEPEAGELDGERNQLVEQAEDWIRDNHTVAMLGGFGLGVFIGVLLRR